MPKSVARTPNRVLSRLSRADFDLIKPDLEPVDLAYLQTLEIGNSRISAVYFIDSGFASVVADGPGKRDIEVGIIGREGMTGLPLLLGRNRARHTTYIQAAGTGHRMSAVKLRQAMRHSPALHQSLLQCVHAFLVQTTETALANGRGRYEQRLARWLLMADDRLDGGELPLTHKLLAIMLGTQRPGVTLAVQVLERGGLIKARRRVITILDRPGLERLSDGVYVRPDRD